MTWAAERTKTTVKVPAFGGLTQLPVVLAPHASLPLLRAASFTPPLSRPISVSGTAKLLSFGSDGKLRLAQENMSLSVRRSQLRQLRYIVLNREGEH